MNDVYRLNQQDKTFTWELIEVPTKVAPEPRSSFAACLATDTSFYIFGGSGDNNVKYNDLWEFNAATSQWTALCKGTPFSHDSPSGAEAEDQPIHKSGHQITLFKNKHILVFGGIHEVTYEMNDLKIFDVVKKTWSTIDEENKHASESGSPKNKSMMQQNESFKKNMFTLKNQTLNLDNTLQNTQSSPKKGDQTGINGATSPSNRFNNNPFLTIKTRSLSATKRSENSNQQESSKEAEPGEGLLTPTSIQLKNAFIIKNADASFDQYYQMMKKRKSPHGSPGKLTGTGNLQFAPHHSQGAHIAKDGDQGQRIKIISEKQPPGRDGHSSFLYKDKWFIFGGDRHHMPFNDTYVLDLAKLNLE